VTRLGH